MGFRFLAYTPELDKAFKHVPVLDTDTITTGQPQPFFQEILENLRGDEDYWEDKNSLADLTQNTSSASTASVRADPASSTASHPLPPILFIGGWLDFFLEQMLVDFEELQSLVSNKSQILLMGSSHWGVGAGRVEFDFPHHPACLSYFLS
jgi:hypothetical protein